MSLGSESKQNEAYERKIKFEMKKSGYKFITLVYLGRKNINYHEIGGVEVLRPIPYIENNQEVFQFKKSGGSIKFTPDRMYDDYPVCHLLDTPHNRKFLATHYDPDSYEIIDDDIDAQIRGLRTKIGNKLKEHGIEDEEFQKEIADLNDAIVAADDLKTKNQLTNKLTNLISSHGKKKQVVEERKRAFIPKAKPIKQLRSQKKSSTELVKVDEH